MYIDALIIVEVGCRVVAGKPNSQKCEDVGHVDNPIAVEVRSARNSQTGRSRRRQAAFIRKQTLIVSGI